MGTSLKKRGGCSAKEKKPPSANTSCIQHYTDLSDISYLQNTMFFCKKKKVGFLDRKSAQ